MTRATSPTAPIHRHLGTATWASLAMTSLVHVRPPAGEGAPTSPPPLRELRKSPGRESKSLSGRPQTNKGLNRLNAADLKCVSALPCSIRYSKLDDVP